MFSDMSYIHEEAMIELISNLDSDGQNHDECHEYETDIGGEVHSISQCQDGIDFASLFEEEVKKMIHIKLDLSKNIICMIFNRLSKLDLKRV